MKNKFHNYKSGQALMISTIFFVVISAMISVGFSVPTVRQLHVAEDLIQSRQGYFLAESGTEDAVYRIKNGLTIDSSESITLSGQTVNTSITDVSGRKMVTSDALWNSYERKVETELIYGTGVAFHYGVQAGEGGILMENNSFVTGNAYSNGPLVGSGNSISGDAVSAGPTGLIDGISVGGSAYAHTISDSTVIGNAYYQTKTNTTVSGTSFPGSDDQDTGTLPITDDQIDTWKAGAEAGGVTSCSGTKKITTSSTIGPRKYTCSLEISGNVTVTLAGPIWAVGNISIKNNAVIRVSSSLGAQSVSMIADNPSNRSSGSTVSLENNGKFYGSGTSGSYILLISQNNSSQNGGSTIAVDVKNNTEGDLLIFAGHGEVLVENNIGIKELSGYKLHIQNNAEIIYETGLANLLFNSGPSGGYEVNSWKEVE